MKKVLWFILLVLLLTNLSFAMTVDDCGENIRCRFKFAAQTGDLVACESLDSSLAINCKDFVSNQDKNFAPLVQSNVSKDVSSTSLFPLVGMVITIIILILLVLFLFFEHYRHISFMNDNPDLVKYVKQSLKEKKSEVDVRLKLKKVGWKEDIIDEAIRGAKHIKK